MASTLMFMKSFYALAYATTYTFLWLKVMCTWDVFADITSPDVFGMRHQFKVRWVHAQRHVAEMVDV